MWDKRFRVATILSSAGTILSVLCFVGEVTAQSCNQVVLERKGVLSTKSYPFNYRNNLSCTYTFYRYNRDTCWLDLKIIDFSVQPSDRCTKDYLLVGEGRLCGSLEKGYTVRLRFESGKDYLSIHFVTDDAITRRGFVIEHNLVECEETVIRTTWKPSTFGPVKFICPFKNALFPHEKLCRLYYECTKHLVVLKECPPGTLFHEEVVENQRYAGCEDKDKVNCAEKKLVQT
ncbi:protein SpAN-like isoform X2 [Tachypleus tridentatus]|uniref:protein SpAN-like isoform X2 n=1 Tax=Tachypleus tridentatus TaxID=6853 RepID=UPI003FD1E489